MKIETQLEFVPDHKVATVVFTKKNSKKELILMGIELASLDTKKQKKLDFDEIRTRASA